MKLSGKHPFQAPRDDVWEALFDPEILASVMPGCKKLEKVGEEEYEGVLKMKVGPVQGIFDGKIRLTDIRPPESYHMDVDGRGQPGFVNAAADVRLVEEDDGTTTLHYESDAKIGGRIATVGQRLLDSSAKSITRQSLDGLAKVVETRSATPEGEAAPEAEGPSQSQMARTVVKDVAKDLVPMPVLIGIVVAILVILLLVFLL